MAHTNLSALRKDFPMLNQKVHGKPLIYFDTAASALKPQRVIDRIVNFYTNEYGTVHRAIYSLSQHSTEEYEGVRTKVMHHLNAEKREEIVFTRGTTDSINMLSLSIGKKWIESGDEIILSEIEHHANIVPWQMLAEEKNAKIKIIPVNDRGELDLAAYEALFSSRTKLVATQHISNALGTIHPVKKIIEIAHANGAKVLLDGAQAAPHQKIDVQDLDVDFYVFSGHKTYGPTGVGILYGKYSLLEELPPSYGGGDMIEKVTFEKTTYQLPPIKFEAGTPLIAQVLGLGAALDYLNEVGLDNITNYENTLLAYATAALQKIQGVHIYGTAPNKAPIISFNIEGIHHLDIGTLLDLDGIAVRTGHHCCQPIMDRFSIPGTVRLSFSFTNTQEEIDTFIASLKSAISTLQ